MGAVIKLPAVAGPITLTERELLDLAVEPVPDGQHIFERAALLAGATVAFIQMQKDPAPLASVALLIGDQRLKIAFLEAVGAHLI